MAELAALFLYFLMLAFLLGRVVLGPEIRVNVLCPGVIDTPLPRQIAAAGGAEAVDALMRSFEELHVVAHGPFSENSTSISQAIIPILVIP